MDGMRGSGDQFVEKELLEIEARLASVFVPVEPSPVFVKDLKQKLMDSAEISIEEHSSGGLRTILFVIASVISGTFLVILGIKGVRHIREAVNMHQLKNGKSPAAI